ncbi:pol ii transcription elongation factor subunit cdc73 [Lasallia pustulata]|uniref:Pol ii transcription elongation factor subunit cdc73 n=1 Tax=Lasallia pustulata TaxID=136370 RepID=A0A1W5D3Q2_9LECA|nr:pol ii transcription elongation factor subunit cdc73 [Lasallia pustulata]
MESADGTLSDPLLSLRLSIASNRTPIPTTSADATAASDATESLAIATHLQFSEPNRQSFPLDAPTRFISSDKPVDLRSIYFAWQKKDVAIPDYIASAQQLNEELSAPGGAGGKVQNLVFVERLDLITWLEGASDESEYIKPLDSDATAAQAAGSAQVASGAAGGVTTVPSSAVGGRLGKTIDPRLQEIYNGERRMGDRNSILRGIKPTDFSHVRKTAEIFLGRNRSRSNHPSSTNASIPPNPSNTVLSKKSTRRPDPIILLSPSASSLLRMSNIKSFLDSGVYIPPDNALAGSSTTANILHISRLLPSIEASRPLRFILVDTPEQFKPDYWSRVVAVFTTGQTWQFKSYKWQSPPDLFKNVLGIYVGWRGEDVPESGGAGKVEGSGGCRGDLGAGGGEYAE